MSGVASTILCSPLPRFRASECRKPHAKSCTRIAPCVPRDEETLEPDLTGINARGPMSSQDASLAEQDTSLHRTTHLTGEGDPMSTPAPTEHNGGYFPHWKEKTGGVIMPEERLPWGQTIVSGLQHS